VTLRRYPPLRRARPLGQSAVLAVAACALLTACGFGPPPADQSGQPPTFPTPTASASSPGSGDSADAAIEVLATKLPQPWGLGFLPDGSALVTERTAARIVKVGPQQTPAGALTVTDYLTVPGVATTGDGGLLGIAVSPHYTSDHTVYVYYSTSKDNRIAAIRPDHAPQVILDDIPHGTTDNGGGLGFGPDGFLYASTGDAGHSSGAVKAVSQSPTSLAGKILRMTTSGRPAPDNPRHDSVIYASGFHNVEGFAWDLSKHLYAMDAGTTRSDNLDVITSGGNYGWPIAGTANVPAGVKIQTPIQTWPLATSGCSGVATLSDVLATACLAGQQMWMLQLTAHASPFGAPGTLLTKTYGRLRTVATASDGSLWIATSNTDGHGSPKPTDDQLIRVVISDEGAGKS
jgi:glucose/arabinose dehydrogenase